MNLQLSQLKQTLDSGKTISKKFGDVLLSRIHTNFRSSEQNYWDNLYSHPLEKFCHTENVIKHKNTTNTSCVDIIIDYIETGINAYDDLIKKISEKVVSVTTCVIQPNDTPQAFLYLELKSLSYRRCGNLYKYMNMIKQSFDLINKSLKSFSLAFLTDPRIDTPLLEISQICDSINAIYPAIFYAFKGVYGVAHPMNCVNQLNNLLTSSPRLNESTFDSLILDFCNRFIKNTLKTLDVKFYSNLVTSFKQQIDSCLSEPFYKHLKNVTLFQSDTSNTLIYASAIMIFILDILRQTDSTALCEVLPSFILILKHLIESLKTFFMQHHSTGTTAQTRSYTSTSSTSQTAFSFKSHIEILISDDDVSISEEFENSSSVFDDENEYLSELDGIRPMKNKIQTNSESSEFHPVRLLEIVKLALEWFLCWPEGGDTIQEVTGEDIQKLLDDFEIYLPCSPPIENIMFFYEDFIYFGYPKFSDIYNACSRNFPAIQFSNDIEQDTLRISYVSAIIQSNSLFKFKFDPATLHNMKLSVWYKRKHLSRSRKRSKWVRTRKSDNIDHSASDSEEGSTSQDARGFHEKKSGKTVKVNIVPFLSPMYDERFVKRVIFSKSVRILVPNAVIEKLDSLKSDSMKARATVSYIHENCHPRFTALRVQQHEAASALKKLKDDRNMPLTAEYIHNVFETARNHDPNLIPGGKVIVVINRDEFLSLFGTEDVLASTTDQLYNRAGFLRPAIEKGLAIMMKDEFIKTYL